MVESAWQLCCPVSLSDEAERITLAQGEGGRAMRQLIEQRIIPRLTRSISQGPPGDAAVLATAAGALAFTTDSYVVTPLFFPGGDIGRLAVFGTVNDLVVAGAHPRWISLSLIMEEGLPVAVLEQILDSVALAAVEANVEVVTGDTKVVPRGTADGLFINTSGIGELPADAPPGPQSLQEGDELIVSGPIGSHGIAILAAREQLGFTPPPKSDCACLQEAVQCLRDAGLLSGEAGRVRAMRDATRGGVTAVLHEWAQACGQTLNIDERAIPMAPDVRGATELLGLDPLCVPCEGAMLLAVQKGAGQQTMAALRQSSVARQAVVIGEVLRRGLAPVTVLRSLGSERPLDEPTAALLPRIC